MLVSSYYVRGTRHEAGYATLPSHCARSVSLLDLRLRTTGVCCLTTSEGPVMKQDTLPFLAIVLQALSC
jgi:hypothetical protein